MSTHGIDPKDRVKSPQSSAAKKSPKTKKPFFVRLLSQIFSIFK